MGAGEVRLPRGCWAVLVLIMLQPQVPAAHKSAAALINEALRVPREQSISLLEEAIRLEPHRPEAYINLGVALNDGREYLKAEESYRTALSLPGGKRAVTYHNLANVMSELSRDIDEVLKAHMQAWDMIVEGGGPRGDEGNYGDQVAFSLISKLREAGRQQECADVGSFAAALYPNHSGLRHTTGLCHGEVNDALQSSYQYMSGLDRINTADSPGTMMTNLAQSYSGAEGAVGSYMVAEHLCKAALESEPCIREALVSVLGVHENLDTLSSPEATEYKNTGFKCGHWPSPLQRPQFRVGGIRSAPFWQKEAFSWVNEVEKAYPTILAEFHANYNPDPVKTYKGFEKQFLHDSGNWTEFHIITNGAINYQNFKRVPKTVELFERFPEITTNTWGNLKFSVLAPKTHIRAHCGPTNARLRAHLGLVIPKDGGARIRVGSSTKRWENGKVFIFDDSFEHEVWNDSDEYRAIMIIDLWHPDISPETRKLVMTEKQQDIYEKAMRKDYDRYNEDE